mmetsp:Transcript_38085/g.65068  ORF Transcript_38085/g.65068 Transcript_38085/m.65068 type:complete len:172 (-) Transcript_38085:149-664(-)
MGEPFGTFLMPIYAILSWYGLIAHGKSGAYVLPVALVGWVWALINIIVRKSFDLGIVTFFLVLLASAYEKKCGFSKGPKVALCVSSIAVAANFALVPILWSDIQTDLANTRSDLWQTMFWWYCVTFSVYWVCASIRTYFRGENTIEYSREQRSTDEIERLSDEDISQENEN